MTQVDLRFNELDVFEEGVFKDLLQQMMSVVRPPIISYPIGYVNVDQSIFFNTFSNLIPYI